MIVSNSNGLPNFAIVIRDEASGPLFGIHPVPIEYYPDQTPLIRPTSGHHGVITHPSAILLRPNFLTEFFAAMFWVDAMQERDGHYAPVLILPMVPGARQDRLMAGDQLFTIKSIARAINARGFSEVVVLDPHSDVTSALIDRCRVTMVERLGARELQDTTYAGVISPDAGAIRRANTVANLLGAPLYHGWKRRNTSDGSITEFGMEPLGPGHYLVVDDICDGGATFVGLAAEISRRGASADLYVTHGLFSKGTETLLTHYKRIYTTDSIIQTDKALTVLPVCFNLLLGAPAL